MQTIENLLIPGRHQVLTNAQEEYLRDYLNADILTDIDGQQLKVDQNPSLIWAVTSANHGNTKRNPISGDRRMEAIAMFGAALGAESQAFPIHNVGPNDRFADLVVKEINSKRPRRVPISPENTAVVCSTPEVIPMYKNLGYVVLGAELDMPDDERYRPWNCVEDIAAAGADWRRDLKYLSHVHPASKRILEGYDLGDQIVEIFQDPLLDGEGDITATRDYETYEKAFKEGAERKYALIQKFIRNGRIVDIGCAGGEILELMAKDPNLFEADLFGFEASRDFYELCEDRRKRGHFQNDHIFFHQGNFMGNQVFPEDSIDTTTTFSLTHEIESYQGRDKLEEFIQRIYTQTAPGGRYINLDVVGPENGSQEVMMRLADLDGRTETEEEIIARPILSAEELEGLSTLGKFRRFAHDFRAGKRQPGWSEEVVIDDEIYIKLSLADASDFLCTKDYTKSWYSEMKETFCYWSFSDWKAAVEKVGFTVHPESRAFRNQWIVENRFEGKAALFEIDGKTPIDFPDTNMLLVAEKA